MGLQKKKKLFARRWVMDVEWGSMAGLEGCFVMMNGYDFML